MAFNDINDQLVRSGGPTIKIEQPGGYVDVEVIDAEYRQKTDIKDGTPKTFPDGKPKLQLVLTVMRDGADEEERIFMHWTAEKALGKWLREKGEKLERGSRLRIKRLDDVPPKTRGESPQQTYDVQHKPAPLTQPSAGDF